MAQYEIGDLVVLKSGSMRMVVADVSEDGIGVVWCHEGIIGRETFDVRLLNKWEHREDQGQRGGDRKPYGGGDRGGDRGDRKPWGNRDGDRGGDAPRGGGYRGDRDNDRGDRGDRGGPREGGYRGRDDDRGGDRPRRTGWDGKPREKKYFRKDD